MFASIKHKTAAYKIVMLFRTLHLHEINVGYNGMFVSCCLISTLHDPNREVGTIFSVSVHLPICPSVSENTINRTPSWITLSFFFQKTE